MTLDELRIFGADVDDGLARCMNNEEFYLKMVDKCLADPKFAELGGVLSAGDLDMAYEISHALKGTVSNLSLTPLRSEIEKLTDLLRNRAQIDYNELYEAIMTKKKDLDRFR
ncbi:MAG: hypothetical protein K6F54_01010 [Lachnospiraceae bacterium]|nr:hypothetical protein [Lachnospiraceae bacterium]